MQVLEREEQLVDLAAALTRAVSGDGRVVLVGGEAGIGKTTLIKAFVSGPDLPRVFWGTCDDLLVSRPFGPIIDMTLSGGGGLLPVLHGGEAPGEIFRVLHDRLLKPAILVFEDMHWADYATLDLLKLLGRRIGALPVLVIASYREDEIHGSHPLRRLLGALATSRATHRIGLARLSRSAIREMVGHSGMDPELLHRRTGGNPFLVREVLAHGQANAVPPSVSDIILARAADLDARAQHLLRMLALIGQRVEPGLLDGSSDTIAALQACEAKGLVAASGEAVRFRHDLVRQAIDEAIPAPERAILHRDILRRMIATGIGDPARLAHHAEGAGDADAAIRFATDAGVQAAAAGAHREAAEQYARALRFDAGDPRRAPLLEALGTACAKLDRQSDAVDALAEATRLHAEAGATLASGQSGSLLASALVRDGRNLEAEEASLAAIATLRRLGEPPELAEAMRVHAHLRMLDRDTGGALAWGRRAIRLARRSGASATIAGASIAIGAALLVGDDPRGLAHLHRALQIARRDGLAELEALAYGNIGSAYGETYHLRDAEDWLHRGIAFAAARDLDYAHHYCVAWLALVHLYRGRWSEAVVAAQRVLCLPDVPAVSRIMALAALGRARARSGTPGSEEALNEALDLALPTRTLQRIAPVRAARAEAAHLRTEPDAARREAAAALPLAMRHRHPWHVGELLYWISGHPTADAPAWVAPPFALELSGAWRDAAEAWDALGCPYEAARARAGGDVEAKLQALRAFDALGAVPAADNLRRALRRAGNRNIPRGPSMARRRSRLGLTPRQTQILSLLVEGLPNSRIARRLRISTRTVDHHVAAILAALEVSSRKEAADAARALDDTSVM